MRPISKSELKILVYNRVKRGVPYDQAVKELKEEMKAMQEVKEFEKAKRKQKKVWIREN